MVATKPGAKIGSYWVERVLGRGGFGVVYAAIDGRLGRRAAIKQLLPELTRERDIVERFFNEARAAAAIDHPGIVEIYEVGWHDDGSAYFAMKLLDGDSLGTRLRARKRLPIDLACAIGRQIASALVAAHARGIVHRDLKPDNVILVPDEETAIGVRATLLDFGIAKLREDDALSSHTRTGIVMGTPSYMSPEQCRGAGAVDARTDVYALGCILFEALAGRPPFVAGGSGAVLGMHQFVAAPDVRAHREDTPPELAALVARTLAKEPADRPAMEELAVLLRPFAAGGAKRRAPYHDPGAGRTDDPSSGSTTGGISERLPPSQATVVGRYTTPAPSVRPRRVRRRHLAIAAGALAGAVLGAIALFAWRSPREVPRAPALAIASDAAPPDAAPVTVEPDTVPPPDASPPPDAPPPRPPAPRPPPPPARPRIDPTARPRFDPALAAALGACQRGDLEGAAHHIADLPPHHQAIARAACARSGMRVDTGSTPPRLRRPPPPPPRTTTTTTTTTDADFDP